MIFVYDLYIYIKNKSHYAVGHNVFLLHVYVCNIKHYFWLKNIGTFIVPCQEVHVFNTRVVLIKTKYLLS